MVALQKRLLGLQKLCVVGSTGLGLAWWLLWNPFAEVAFTWLGVDFVARVAPTMPWRIGGGIVGLVAAWVFHGWACSRPALHARLKKNMAGPNLVAANAELNALRELESGPSSTTDA